MKKCSRNDKYALHISILSVWKCLFWRVRTSIKQREKKKSPRKQKRRRRKSGSSSDIRIMWACICEECDSKLKSSSIVTMSNESTCGNMSNIERWNANNNKQEQKINKQFIIVLRTFHIGHILLAVKIVACNFNELHFIVEIPDTGIDFV